jgi:hypothetical protein
VGEQVLRHQDRIACGELSLVFIEV